MYIFKNAFRCIARAKGRNFLIGLVVLLLSVSSCIGLSIKEANRTLKKQYADEMEISATVNPKDMRKERTVSLDKLTELSGNSLVKAFNYSSSVYFAAGDGIEPLDVSGSFKQNKDFRDKYGDVENGETRTTTKTETTTSSNNSKKSDSKSPDFPGGFPPGGGNITENKTFITNNSFFFNMASMNDFTVTAYNTEEAIPEYISSLGVLSSGDKTLNCVISKSLADENELKKGSTFTLKNPDNEDETYTFTVAGIYDSSESSESQDTSSNASFTDNYIYISKAAMEDILKSSLKTNPETETDDDSDEEEESKALTANYKGTFIFANLDDFNAFKDSLDENYTLVSEDVSNYEQSISQLETLGKYATYFLIVIFVIGAFVLIIINLFSIRNRKYEIGVLTAIGMKKWKVATQFVVELFVVTFAALIIGSAVGSVTSVPVTNNLLVTINSEETAETETAEEADNSSEKGGKSDNGAPGGMTPPGGFGGDFKQMMGRFGGNVNNYIASITSATDINVIFEMILVGMGLTLISSAAAVTFVMRYEPLKILNNRD
ncbi:MAG: ABC transporter permease [Clostridia bacterium]|nr:ABC transporter permease [Clostridia bacterium]